MTEGVFIDFWCSRKPQYTKVNKVLTPLLLKKMGKKDETAIEQLLIFSVLSRTEFRISTEECM
jgi:hypothetical protein